MARSLASNTLAKSLYSIGSTEGGDSKGSDDKDKEKNRQTNQIKMEDMELLAEPVVNKALDQDNDHSSNIEDSTNVENQTTTSEERHQDRGGLIEERLRQQMKAAAIDLEDTDEEFTDAKGDSRNTDNKEGQDKEDTANEMEDEDYKDTDSTTTSNKTIDSHYGEGSITDEAQ